MEKEQIWQVVLGEIELTLSRANFTTWFKNTSISDIQEDRIIISVPNNFTKTWLEKKYHKEISLALERIINKKIKEIIYKIETIKRDNGGSRPAGSANNGYSSFEPQPQNRFGLNNRYTFENFIVGKGNELAHAACQAVAANPGRAYNPLFIYGGVGLGKTHLIQAVGHELAKKTSKILFVTSEKFTNDYIQAVRNGRAKEFKDTYRNVDLFLVDDIQFISGKESTQEEFFHTFNELHQSNKQVVVASDRPPKSIPYLEKRLLSRFEWGMIADVSQPDLETRVAILDAKCRERNFLIPIDLLNYVAENVVSNIRELEGVLNRLIAYHEFNNTKPTLDSLKQVLGGIVAASVRPTSSKRIIEAVSGFYEAPINDITGKSRKKELVKPRQIIMYLLRTELNISYPTIGNELGGRDHTTAMHAFVKVSKEVGENARVKQEIDAIKQLLSCG
ncbi:MAG: chromosomal replication initiator protein DnaA [Patescibacteria group bacterium]|jgi:chromosomal replication initiator protein